MQGTKKQLSSSFQEDVNLLRKSFETIILKDRLGKGLVAIVPGLQARVMTSSCRGWEDEGFGWINQKLTRSGIQPKELRSGLEKQIHVFGGEERFWLGPEGGQFGLFFPESAPNFDFQYWKTPDFIDTQSFELLDSTGFSASFQTKGDITNRYGTTFQMEVDRKISILESTGVANLLNFELPAELSIVAYQTENEVTNIGTARWNQETGCPSIWLLGMFKPDPSVVMIVPYQADNSETPVCQSDYFQIPGQDRLIDNGNCLLFKGDGKFRSKIGIPAGRSKPFCGSYSSQNQSLTILHYNLPVNAANRPYVKSQWEDHKNPYAGDVVNCYNDGSPGPGLPPLGPFYELESSSPALELASKESYTHRQSTIHLQGTVDQLEKVSRQVFGIRLNEVASAFG